MQTSEHSSKLRGKIVVITGASSGFGKGAARALARAGCHLVLAARRTELLVKLAQECGVDGSTALVLPTDVSSPDEMENLLQQTVDEFGHIDIWINDAGVGVLGPFEKIPLADQLQVMHTNLGGTISGSFFAMQQFHRQQQGVLINIASALGKIPAPYYASYTASKYGIVGLGAVLRQELRERKIDGIHVCTILPMAMDTPFFDHIGNYSGHEAVPVPPLYDPQDVVDAILKVAVDPEDEIIVGGMGKISNVMHHLAPAATEKFMARQTHKAQMEEAPAASDSTGAVHEPMEAGAGFRGGRLSQEKV